jgi:NADH-quinone oxidoreductase subunit D
MSEATFQIPVGPQHPALKEAPENFMFTIDGEYVVNVRARIGYNHRGIEKAAESRSYVQNLYLVERICGICSAAHITTYALAVEEALKLEIPSRANYIRTIIYELNRIASHSLWLGLAGHEIGFDTLFMYLWRDREIALNLLEQITGNRVTYAMPAIGGVRRDITPQMAENVKRELSILEGRMKYYKKLCLNEPTVLKRTVGVGILKPQDAIALCAVGPTLRASGVKSDVRADDPYLVYDEIPFDVVTYDGCDVASRVLVRCDEILASIGIIKHALDHLPDGPIRIKVPRIVPPAEVVSRSEAPRGELIHYLKSNGTDKPERLKIRSPTLGNIPSICKFLVGGFVADIPIALASADPCFTCTDRMAFVNVSNGKRWVWTHEQLRRYSLKWHQQS